MSANWLWDGKPVSTNWLWDHLFGPDVDDEGQKKDAQAEAARPVEPNMSDVAQAAVEYKEVVPVSEEIMSDRSSYKGIVRGFNYWSAELAGRVLEQTRFPEQKRDLTQEGQITKEVLAEMMRLGIWREFDKLDFARLPDGTIYMLNGHHRTGAQAMSGKTIPWVVVIHDVTSLEEAQSLYWSFDTNVRIRTEEQIASAARVLEGIGLGKTMRAALLRAVPFIAADLDPSRASREVLISRIPDLKFEFAGHYAGEAVTFQKCIYEADKHLKPKLRTQGAIAVAMVTLKYQPERAEEFWRGIGENDGLAKGDPRNTYIRALSGKFPRVGTNWYTAAIAASAWNAWYRHETPRHFSPGEPRPIRLLGTPFDSER